MALRRPLVRVGGELRQLPDGDLIPAQVLDLQQYTPAFTAGDVLLKLRHVSYGVLHALQSERTMFGMLMMGGNQADVQALTAQMAELGEKEKLIKIKYDQRRKENAIKRREARKKLAEE